ncbi:MAG TPA: class I SAM-dependent methyltransferase [Phycisphaerales bacterium]|nr:class I SAM-dependent methyltransferase [Phycisphaerales bacterium]HRQ74492.1 class I SAM-dependent methyltransferase [Phycisphaerales bacterium]
MTLKARPHNPLDDPALMARLISDVTGTPIELVSKKLRDEFAKPGSTVAAAFHERNIRPYVAGADMDRFYADTDAFLYETAIWNRNRAKRQMRKWVLRHLQRYAKSRNRTALDVLMLGDGMGFDSIRFASAGHQLTYMELPGLQVEFAKRLFGLAGKHVRMVTDPDLLRGETFDAVIAIDVLEHVPDPPSLVRTMAAHLRPGGRLISHAPFYMIHPAYPTHLKNNRRFSGSLSLYTNAGLNLVDGQLFWNPLVLEKPAEGLTRRAPLRSSLLQLTGLYLRLGRVAAFPFYPIHWYRCARQRWFGQ